MFAETAPSSGFAVSICRAPHPADEAHAVATELLRTEPGCTAAITTGWQFTGLLGALREAGLHVPDDFSIVSVIAAQFAEMLTPP